MANDKARKTLMDFATRENILGFGEQKWYQGKYYSDNVSSPRISESLRQRIVNTCDKLFDTDCKLIFGVIVGIPFVTIGVEDQQYPRMVLVFKETLTELRWNNSLLDNRYDENLIDAWMLSEESIGDLVKKTVFGIIKDYFSSKQRQFEESASQMAALVAKFA